jgi:sorting nexin-8
MADLPVPKLPSLSRISASLPKPTELAASSPQRPDTPPAPTPISPQKIRTTRKDSLEFPEADPWGSPALHRGHDHETPRTNGNSRPQQAIAPREPVRTTSDFTTASADRSNGGSNPRSENTISTPTGGVWGSYEGQSSGPYGNPDPNIGGGGFGGAGGDGRPPNPASRSFGGGRVTNTGPEENVVITLLPEKEGIFMFQHHNYQVTSARRGSKVVRRYSDFVWLLDCLQKRFPFRQIPLLPPKRVGGV